VPNIIGVNHKVHRARVFVP